MPEILTATFGHSRDGAHGRLPRSDPLHSSVRRQPSVQEHDLGIGKTPREGRRFVEMPPRRLQVELQAERLQPRKSRPPHRIAHAGRPAIDAAFARLVREVWIEAAAGQAHDRRHIDDRAAARRDHRAGRLARAEKYAGEVDLDDLAPVGGRQLDRRPAQRSAGIVHEDVYAPETLQRLRERRLDRRFVGDVHVPHKVIGVAGPQLAARLVERRRVAIEQNRHGSRFHQGLHRRPANAPGATGDDRHASGERRGQLPSAHRGIQVVMPGTKVMSISVTTNGT